MFYCKVDGSFVAPPTPASAYVRNTLQKFLSRLCSLLPVTTPISPEQLVEMYEGRKRKIMQAGAEKFMQRGVSRGDSVCTPFVKSEKVKPDSAPRCINPRNVVYNVALGCYIKPVEHRIYLAIQRHFRSSTPVVFKGLNVDDMGLALREKWDHFVDPVAVGLDAVKFDMHVSAAMLGWEHLVYKHIYRNDAQLRKLLKWQINNIGKGYCFDGTVKYKISGRRCSGDMNTALGNCIIMCGMISSYCAERKVKFELANNGDDCVIIMERRDLARFSIDLDEWFLKLGFRMTVEKAVDVFEKIEFCQMQPVLVSGHYRMIRNFWKSREKDTIALIDITAPTAFAKWMGAVGEGGLALNSGVPVLQEFYRAYARVGISSNINNAVQMQSGALFLRIGMEAKWSKVDDESRLSFFEAFGLTPDEQTCLEDYYKQIDLSYSGSEAVDNLILINPSPF